jgi:hypothetical protein
MKTPLQLREEFYEKFPLSDCSDATSESVADYWLAKLEEARKEAIGEIGAKLLAKHSPQAVLDAYFDAANEVLENETNN